MLEIRLLGGLDLRLDGRRLRPLNSGRAESLLAYLLLHRDAPQSRQGIAFLLWPDSSESEARTNLRHLVHKLRRAVPDAERFLDLNPRTLQWRSGAPCRPGSRPGAERPRSFGRRARAKLGASTTGVPGKTTESTAER